MNTRMPVTERYHSDATFRALVDTLYCQMDQATYSPTEIREAAMLAHILYEERRIKPMIVDDPAFLAMIRERR